MKQHSDVEVHIPLQEIQFPLQFKDSRFNYSEDF